MSYRKMNKTRRSRIERRLQSLFKAYGSDAETVANAMITRRRIERRNRSRIARLQKEIEDLKR